MLWSQRQGAGDAVHSKRETTMHSSDKMFRDSLQAQLTDALGREPHRTEDDKIDLAGEGLRQAQLRGVDLAGANLERTRFNGASLVLADLRDSYCHRATFDGADLKGANLEGARRLTPAQLAKARNLEYAYLDPGRYADAVAAGYRSSK